VLRVLMLLAVLGATACAADGPFLVDTNTLTLVDATRGRTIVTEVWHPTGRRGRWPLVLVAHGNCGFRTNYEYLSVLLASRGFVVAAPDFPGLNKAACDANGGEPSGYRLVQPARDLSILREFLHYRGGAAGDVARLVRGRRTGLVGHSLGGTAVANASIADEDFVAVVALSPLVGTVAADALHDLRLRRAVMVILGTADTLLPPDFITPFFDRLSFPSFLVKIVGGTHSGFTDMDAVLAPAQLARQQELTRRYTFAFLARYLGRERRFRRVLTPEDAAAQGSDVELVARLR
jgi:dienelactone hydrolase